MRIRGFFTVILTVASLAALQALAAEEPEIVAKAVKDAAQSCTEMGGKPNTEAMLSVDDLNRDSAEDWLVDYSKMACEGATNPFCGSGGCSLSIYLWRKESIWRLVYDDLVNGFEVRKTGKVPLLITTAPAGECGKEEGVCEERFSITRENIRLVSGSGDRAHRAKRHSKQGKHTRKKKKKKKRR